VGLDCLCSMVTMETKLFTAVNSVKLGSSTSDDLCRDSRRISSSQNFLFSLELRHDMNLFIYV
jgi:hypothetical protein